MVAQVGTAQGHRGSLSRPQNGRQERTSPTSRPSCFLNRLAEFCYLKLKDLGLLRSRGALVFELGTENIKLLGLHLQEPGLLFGRFLLVGDLLFNGVDFLPLLEKGEPRQGQP